MEFKEIIEDIKSKKIETVGINLQIPKDTKIKFDLLCKKNGVTVTSVLNAFIEKSISKTQN